MEVTGAQIRLSPSLYYFSLSIALGMYVGQHTHTDQLLSSLHHCYLGMFYKSVVFLFEIQM